MIICRDCGGTGGYGGFAISDCVWCNGTGFRIEEDMPILEGELDKSAETDKDVSIDIDPATQVYHDSADAIIASLKGDSLAMARVKCALPPLLAGLQAASVAVPGAGPAISGAIGIINAISGKL